MKHSIFVPQLSGGMDYQSRSLQALIRAWVIISFPLLHEARHRHIQSLTCGLLRAPLPASATCGSWLNKLGSPLPPVLFVSMYVFSYVLELTFPLLLYFVFFLRNLNSLK